MVHLTLSLTDLTYDDMIHHRGLYEQAEYTFLGVYRNTLGMKFTNLSDAGNGMRGTWGIFVVEWVIFMVLGWYLEQVLSSGTGIRRHPLYFLDGLRKKVGGS